MNGVIKKSIVPSKFCKPFSVAFNTIHIFIAMCNCIAYRMYCVVVKNVFLVFRIAEFNISFYFTNVRQMIFLTASTLLFKFYAEILMTIISKK